MLRTLNNGVLRRYGRHAIQSRNLIIPAQSSRFFSSEAPKNDQSIFTSADYFKEAQAELSPDQIENLDESLDLVST